MNQQDATVRPRTPEMILIEIVSFKTCFVHNFRHIQTVGTDVETTGVVNESIRIHFIQKALEYTGPLLKMGEMIVNDICSAIYYNMSTSANSPPCV